MACVTETIHPAGDLPEHSTRQGLVRFARMLSEDLALRYAFRLRLVLGYTSGRRNVRLLVMQG